MKAIELFGYLHFNGDNILEVKNKQNGNSTTKYRIGDVVLCIVSKNRSGRNYEFSIIRPVPQENRKRFNDILIYKITLKPTTNTWGNKNMKKEITYDVCIYI